MICKKLDLKKLSLWANSCQETETSVRFFFIFQGCLAVCYESLHNKLFQERGKCLCQVSVLECHWPERDASKCCLHHFENENFPRQHVILVNCCTECVIKNVIPNRDSLSIVKCVLNCIRKLNGKCMLVKYEDKIVDWISGAKEQHLWPCFNLRNLKRKQLFGFFQNDRKMNRNFV